LAQLCLGVGLLGAIVAGYLRHAGAANSVIISLGHLGLVLFYGWLVWAAARGFRGILGAVLSARPLVYLGKISYGLYVFHLLTGALLPLVTKLLHLPASIESHLAFRITLQAILTVSLATISWYAFEKPLNNLKRYFPYTDRTSNAIAAVQPTPTGQSSGTVISCQ
jgi:peptidoglycan/LPS O-acetylase OafA/YrhL